MIDLYFWPTPNGYKAAIMLAELDLEYRVVPIDITAGEQFHPEFLKINPNNKVPAIVDHDGPHNKPYAVFESAVVLIYLAEKSGRFLSQDPEKRYDTLKWLVFQNTTMGPMLGQAHHFMVYATEKIDYAIERYDREVGRIYNIRPRLHLTVFFVNYPHNRLLISLYVLHYTHSYSAFSITNIVCSVFFSNRVRELFVKSTTSSRHSLASSIACSKLH